MLAGCGADQRTEPTSSASRCSKRAASWPGAAAAPAGPSLTAHSAAFFAAADACNSAICSGVMPTSDLRRAFSSFSTLTVTSSFFSACSSAFLISSAAPRAPRFSIAHHALNEY